MLRKLLPPSLLSAAVALSTATAPAQGAPGFNQPTPAGIQTTPGTSAQQPPAPAQPQPQPVAADERLHVINGIAARLKDSYVLPEMAQRLVDTLETHQKQGDYNDITNGVFLAARLTADLQSVSLDRHLRIEFSASTLPPEEGGPSAGEEQQYRKELERSNCGFQRAEILPGNIGYVQISYFGAPDACASTAAATMKFVSHTDAVIFDIRQNHGGDPSMVALLASYLFDRPTHLDDLYNRHENKTTQYWAKPEKVSDRMPSQPVYVLTSRFSYSGAEQFCYDLHNLGRATLIGEKTGGAAHPTRNRRLSDHFLIAMPEYRYINSITRTDWEGQGVTPDVPAAPWNALQLAQKLALAKVQHSTTPQPELTTASR